MKNIFKEAHKMTKVIAEKYNDVDYKAQFSLCLAYLLENKEVKGMVELKGTEKQIAWAEDIRKNLIDLINELQSKKEEVLNFVLEDAGEEKMKKIEKSYNIMMERAKNFIETETSAKKYIEEVRDEFTNKASLSFTKKKIFVNAYKIYLKNLNK